MTTDNTKAMTLVVVCPCYNEEAVLQLSIDRLERIFSDLQKAGKISKESLVCLVNDGSKDRTWPIICDLHERYSWVRGINLAHNVGHQNAIMAGMLTARSWGDAIITTDADLQDDVENCIPQMVDHFLSGYDIVYGVKTSRTADPFMKRLTAEAFYKLQSSMGVKTIFNHADFRLMSRRVLDMLAGYGEKNLFLRGIIPMISQNSTTIEDVIGERAAGVSKYTLSKMLNLALDGITSFSVRPMWLILHMGLIFILISMCILVYVLRALIVGTAVGGWASLMLSMWFIGGVLLVAIGIVGVYIGKIYTEAKGRPLYNVAEIL